VNDSGRSQKMWLLLIVRMWLPLSYAQSCGIRGNAATDSDGKRPPNPIESDHLIRTKATTLLMG
jgi:hypothetical protein